MRALLSLLSNARDALHGQPNPHVKIEAFSDAQKIIIVVTNSGPLITENVRAKLFQPFFTTKDVGQGAGLGLSTALGIIKAQNGRVYFDAQAPETRFVIELPAA
jgi:C4-dicarboxylate-specific signal transduction histidine kinase